MADVKEKSVKTLSDVYSDYAKKATEKDDYEFSLLETYDVEFTSDFKGIKKGAKFNGIGKVAFDLYDANGVVKKLKQKDGPTDKELDQEDLTK